MARLETEINQIYLTDPESKKSSLILYEEQLNNTSQLFVLAHLENLSRKSETLDLKKISEIILESFRANKKLSGETLFETSLSQINQNLADLAHAGHKSWVGKLSCIIAVKSSDNIMMANNGATSGWLLRQTELLQILAPEKRGTHPLKSFSNFTQGKLINGDSVIITTSNIFNFVSIQLFERILANKSLPEANLEISKILKASKKDEGFASFLLGFNKKTSESAEAVSNMSDSLGVYEPVAENLEEIGPELRTPTFSKFSGLKFDRFKFRLPKFTWPNFKFPDLPKFRFGGQFYKNLSAAGKFFFVSLTIFVLLFLITLVNLIGKAETKSKQNKIDAAASSLATDLADANSSLIYKNNEDALQILARAQADFEALKKLDPQKASEFEQQFEALKDEVNKVSSVSDPKILVTLKHDEIYLTKTSIGLLLANSDSNSLSVYSSALNDYFLLNSLKSNITDIDYYSPAGVVVASNDKLYHIDQTLKQFEPIVAVPDGELLRTQFYNNSLYTLNIAGSSVIKTTFSKNSAKGGSASGGKYSNSLINVGDISDARDFGLDKDIYLLFADKLIKVANGSPLVFAYPTLTDPITNATKIFVGANLYILEPNKKRVVVLNKNGQLLNQIYFPSQQSLSDVTIDEASHNMYLLADNKIYQITF